MRVISQNLMAENKDGVSKTVVVDAKPYQDGGHAWLVCLASFIGYFLVTMGICTSGILFQEFQKEFGGTNAQTAFIPSVQISIGALLGVFISPQVKRYGCRSTTVFGTLLGSSGYILCSFATNITHMYMSLGLLVGIGNGFIFFSSAVAVQFYFHKHRALASALSTCGVSLAPFVFAPTCHWTISVLSWRGATLQMGAIYLHGFVSAGLMSKPPADELDKQCSIEGADNVMDETCSSCNNLDEEATCGRKDEPMDEKACLSVSSKCNFLAASLIEYLGETFDMSLLKHKGFVLFITASSLSLCGHLTTYLYLPVIANSFGTIQVGNASVLIALIGASTTVGRIISGFVGDHALIVSHRHIHYGLPMLLTGISTVLAAFIFKGWMFFLYSTLFGFFTGVYFVAQQPLLVKILGVDMFPKSFGIMLIFTGSASLLAQPFAGWLVDITKTPTTPFILCGSFQALGGMLAMAIGCLQQ